ncbi:MAG: hypothetical protein ACOX4F_05700 [Atopobiaceae bacterium]|jgi:hypothetical protein
MSVDKKELIEAIHAGEYAQECLSSAIAMLKSASNWGLVDILGGNIMSGLFKHQKISKAQAEIQRAQSALAQFQAELNDVSDAQLLGTDAVVSNFLSFADFVFDNPFTDLVVQSKITDAQSQLEHAKGQVDTLMRQLKKIEHEL